MIKSELKVKGMSCGHCSKSIIDGLTKLDGVREVSVILEDKQVVVTFDDTKVSVDKIKEEINDLGFEA